MFRKSAPVAPADADVDVVAANGDAAAEAPKVDATAAAVAVPPSDAPPADSALPGQVNDDAVDVPEGAEAEKSAVKIQSIARGKKDRARVEAIKAEKAASAGAGGADPAVADAAAWLEPILVKTTDGLLDEASALWLEPVIAGVVTALDAEIAAWNAAHPAPAAGAGASASAGAGAAAAAGDGESAAAVKIQSVARGKKDRARVEAIKAEKAASGARETVHTGEATVVKDEEAGTKYVNQYQIHEELGRGAFGKVKRCVSRNDGLTYAVKIMKKSILKRKRVGRFSNALANVAKEIAVWKKLDHMHCVQLYEVIDDPEHDKLFLFGEFVDGGAIMPDKNDVPPLPEDEARHTFVQAVDGLRYLHFERVVHRDIKPGNILKTKDGVVKLADFGVAHTYDESDGDEFRNTAGTMAFFAPEMTTGSSFSGKGVDIWAMGVTLYMMLYGHVPFNAEGGVSKLYERIASEEPEFPAAPPVSDEAKDMIRQLLTKDPEKRPTIEDVARHEWLQSEKDELHALPEAPIEVSDEEVRAALSIIDTFSGVVRAHVNLTRVLYTSEEDAVVAIQRTGRGYLARRRVRRIRTEKGDTK